MQRLMSVAFLQLHLQYFSCHIFNIFNIINSFKIVKAKYFVQGELYNGAVEAATTLTGAALGNRFIFLCKLLKIRYFLIILYFLVEHERYLCLFLAFMFGFLHLNWSLIGEITVAIISGDYCLILNDCTLYMNTVQYWILQYCT